MGARLESHVRVSSVILGLIAALATSAPLAWAQRLPEASHGPSVAAQAPLPGNPSDYVGADTCAACHDAEARSFDKTVHASIGRGGSAALSTNSPATPSSTNPAKTPTLSGASTFRVTGCETCHGPGKAHVDAEGEAAGDHAKETAAARLIFSFHANPKENAARCLACHLTSRSQATFDHSQHLLAGVSCDQCHAAHLVRQVKAANPGNMHFAQAVFFQEPELRETTQWLHGNLLKQAEPNLCFSCHGNVQTQFALPIHHRVPEGLMKCSDCHNPHGSLIASASLNAPFWETCVKCHVEKRGPWVYEHAAVRVEGCVICHNPHGSTNHFMLVRREGRQLCLQCHTGFHTQAQVPHSRLGFQTSGECTRCHVEIHGSNLDVNFLR